MTIEITSVTLNNGIIVISAVDVSEENLQRFERVRDDGIENEITFAIDMHIEKDYIYIGKWLARQKVVKNLTGDDRNWGTVLNSIIGIKTNSPAGRYRVWK